MSWYWLVATFVFGWLLKWIFELVFKPKNKASLYVQYAKDEDKPYSMHLEIKDENVLKEDEILVKIIKVKDEV